MQNVREESCFYRTKCDGAEVSTDLISFRHKVDVVVVMTELKGNICTFRTSSDATHGHVKSFSKFNINQRGLRENYSFFCQNWRAVLILPSGKCPG